MRDKLPSATIIFCAQEYTLRNYSLFCELEPQNVELQEKLQRVRVLRESNQFTVPRQYRDQF